MRSGVTTPSEGMVPSAAANSRGWFSSGTRNAANVPTSGRVGVGVLVWLRASRRISGVVGSVPDGSGRGRLLTADVAGATARGAGASTTSGAGVAVEAVVVVDDA